jgi:hypothetical protein
MRGFIYRIKGEALATKVETQTKDILDSSAYIATTPYGYMSDGLPKGIFAVNVILLDGTLMHIGRFFGLLGVAAEHSHYTNITAVLSATVGEPAVWVNKGRKRFTAAVLRYITSTVSGFKILSNNPDVIGTALLTTYFDKLSQGTVSLTASMLARSFGYSFADLGDVHVLYFKTTSNITSCIIIDEDKQVSGNYLGMSIAFGSSIHNHEGRILVANPHEGASSHIFRNLFYSQTKSNFMVGADSFASEGYIFYSNRNVGLTWWLTNDDKLIFGPDGLNDYDAENPYYMELFKRKDIGWVKLPFYEDNGSSTTNYLKMGTLGKYVIVYGRKGIWKLEAVKVAEHFTYKATLVKKVSIFELDCTDDSKHVLLVSEDVNADSGMSVHKVELDDRGEVVVSLVVPYIDKNQYQYDRVVCKYFREFDLISIALGNSNGYVVVRGQIIRTTFTPSYMDKELKLRTATVLPYFASYTTTVFNLGDDTIKSIQAIKFNGTFEAGITCTIAINCILSGKQLYTYRVVNNLNDWVHFRVSGERFKIGLSFAMDSLLSFELHSLDIQYTQDDRRFTRGTFVNETNS